MTQTILIVDDDPVQRRLLEAAISRMGLATLTAPGGSPALDLLFSPKGEQISLVVLDLMMPDVDGIQVLSKLRAAPATFWSSRQAPNASKSRSAMR